MNKRKNIPQFNPEVSEESVNRQLKDVEEQVDLIVKTEHFDPDDAPTYVVPKVPQFKPPFQYHVPNIKEAGSLKALVDLIVEITENLPNPLDQFEKREAFDAPYTGRSEPKKGPDVFDLEKEWEAYQAYFARMSSMTRYSEERINSRPQTPLVLGSTLELTDEVREYLDTKPMIWLDVNVSLNPNVQGVLLMRRATPHDAEETPVYHIKSGQYLVMRRLPFAEAFSKKDWLPIFVIEHNHETGRIVAKPGFKREKNFLCGDLAGLMKQVVQHQEALGIEPGSDFPVSKLLSGARRGLADFKFEDVSIFVAGKPRVDGNMLVKGGELEIDLFVNTGSTGPFESGFQVRANLKNMLAHATIRIKVENLIGKVRTVCRNGEIRIVPLLEDGLVRLEGKSSLMGIFSLEARMGAKVIFPDVHDKVPAHIVGIEPIYWPAEVVTPLQTLGQSSFGGQSGKDWLKTHFDSSARFFLQAGTDFLNVENKWWSGAFNDPAVR